MAQWRRSPPPPRDDAPPGDLLVLGLVGLAVALVGATLGGNGGELLIGLGCAATLGGATVFFFRLGLRGVEGRGKGK